MVKNKIFFLTITFMFILILEIPAVCQSSENNGISLTWKDLQELLDLNTDKIKISLEEFNRLMKQTGVNIGIGTEIREGVVILRRDQFRRLIAKMKPADQVDLQPPKDYLITKANYKGIARENNSRFVASFKIYIFKHHQSGYLNIPLIHSSLAVKDIKVNGAPAVIMNQGNWHCISIKENGYQEIEAGFSVGNEKQHVHLPIVRSVINHVEFSVAKDKMDIRVNPSVNTSVVNSRGQTRIQVKTMPTDSLEISWVRKAEKKSRQPAIFYASTRSLLSIDDDILRVNTRVTLEVIKSCLDHVSLQVPRNYEIIKVDGFSENQWLVRETGIGRILEIRFHYDVNSSVAFTIHAEQMLPSDFLLADYSGFKVLEARRETGDIGVVAESTVQVNTEEYHKENQGLEKIEYHKLPRGFFAMSSRPILFAYKYVRHPFRLLVHMTKHKRMEGVTTVVKFAEVTSLFLKEGKMLYRAVYTVHNTFKQFMELDMPNGAEIWTVYVDQKRGKASRNEKGKVLIPLLRSSGNGEQIRPFKVELIYFVPFNRFGMSGKGKCLIPACDIFINEMKLEMFMPQDFNYAFNFNTCGWKEETNIISISGQVKDSFMDSSSSISPAENVKKLEYRNEEKSSDEKAGEEKQGKGNSVTGGKVDSLGKNGINPQSINKRQPVLKRLDTKKITGPAGLRSINIHLPLSGKRYIFSKKIINKYERFNLDFSYVKTMIKKVMLYLVVGVLTIGLALAIIYRFKKSRTV